MVESGVRGWWCVVESGLPYPSFPPPPSPPSCHSQIPSLIPLPISSLTPPPLPSPSPLSPSPHPSPTSWFPIDFSLTDKKSPLYGMLGKKLNKAFLLLYEQVCVCACVCVCMCLSSTTVVCYGLCVNAYVHNHFLILTTRAGQRAHLLINPSSPTSPQVITHFNPDLQLADFMHT